MERKHFIKSACGLGIGSCLGLTLFKPERASAAEEPKIESVKATQVVPVDTRQVQNMLSYIESSTDESLKKRIFERLGAEHLSDPGYVNWIDKTKLNLKGYFDAINSNQDTYWEKIVYDPETSAIMITGKPVDRCACPFAQHKNPPLSLCTHCCVGFQKAMFEKLLGKPVVNVKIDESYLMGGKRCSSTVYVEGPLRLEKE